MNQGASAPTFWSGAPSAPSVVQSQSQSQSQTYSPENPPTSSALYGAQSNYNGYTAQAQGQDHPQTVLYHSQQPQASRSCIGMRQHAPESTSSSLQYALRPYAHYTSVSPPSSLTNFGSTQFSQGSSLASSLCLSSLSGVSPLNSSAGDEMASPSPLSPHSLAPPQTRTGESAHSNTQALSQNQNQTHVHSHEYSGYDTPRASAINGASDGSAGSFALNSALYNFESSGPLEREREHAPTPVSGNPARSGPGSSGSGIRLSSPALTQAEMHQQYSMHAHGYAQSSYVHTNAHTRSLDAHAASQKSQGNFNPQANSPIAVRTNVKTEPDLEESRSIHRDSAHSPELSNGGSGGARFVMEHPYPYPYASSARGRDRRGSKAGVARGRSTSPLSPQSGSLYASTLADGLHSPREPDASSADLVFSPFQQIQPQHAPHSLTAPLRAVNASAAMRACMGVFRLDPFAQLNGVALRCGSNFTSDGDSFLSSDFNPKKSKGKSKGKSRKKNKSRNKKRKRSGSDSASPEPEDDDGDEEDVGEDEADDAPTWDGLPAGPLLKEPVLLEFQLYFEGMEVESEPEPEVNNTAPSKKRSKEDTEEFFDDAVESYEGPYLTRGREVFGSKGDSGRARYRVTNEDTLGNRYNKNVYDDDGYVYGRDPPKNGLEDRKFDVQQHERAHSLLARARARTSRTAGVFEEYLDLNLDVDLDMDGWASAEVSPTTPYALSHANANSAAFTQTQTHARTPGTTPTRTPVLNGNGNIESTATSSFASGSFSFTNDYSGESVRERFLDSSGYMRLGDGYTHSTSGPSAQSSGPANPGSKPTAFASLAGTGSGAGQATLQQLRTQAALRAVEAHTSQTQSTHPQALYRGAVEGGGTQRLTSGGGGTGGTVNFTPTPASIAAEMQTGLLVSGRAQQQHFQQQQQQNNNRMRASSVTHMHSPQLHGQVQTLTGPGIGNNVSATACSSYPQAGGVNASSSSYAYPNYAPGKGNSGPGSGSVSLAGALSSASPSPTVLAHEHGDLNGFGDGRQTGARAATYSDSSVQALERRWGDVLQRVHV